MGFSLISALALCLSLFLVSARTLLMGSKLAACSDFGLARRSVLTRNSLKSFLVQFADKGSCWRALSLALCLSFSGSLALWIVLSLA